jgi:hypothetical protein
VGLGVGFGRALTVTILFTGFAARNRLLPACVAVTVVLPALRITSVEPLTLATLLLLLKYITGNRDVARASSFSGLSPTLTAGGCGKLIVCRFCWAKPPSAEARNPSTATKTTNRVVIFFSHYSIRRTLPASPFGPKTEIAWSR